MTTRPSRAGARTSRMLGLPVPYAVPVVQVDDKRGFGSRENVWCAWGNATGLSGAGEHGALLIRPSMPAGATLRIVAGLLVGVAGIAIADPVLQTDTPFDPVGDQEQPAVWSYGEIATADLPAVDAQLTAVMVILFATLNNAVYPEYLIEVEIPAGLALVIWGADTDTIAAFLQAYTVEM